MTAIELEGKCPDCGEELVYVDPANEHPRASGIYCRECVKMRPEICVSEDDTD